jgi:hypothetical protein
MKEDNMVEPREIAETDATADLAAQAFEALRGEVALLRRAIMGLAAERSSLEIPDYSESIARITSMVSSIGKRLVALSELPAFALSPEDFSRQIMSASETVRREDRETIMIGRNILRETVSELKRSLQSAREADKQKKWLIWSASGSALIGMFVWAFGIAPILHWLGISFG